MAEGEFRSAFDINNAIEGFVAKPIGWGQYLDGDTRVYFFLGEFHDMDLHTPPEPEEFISRLVKMHENGTSPNGMFGYPVSTVCGRIARTARWEESWARAFTHLLDDVIRYDEETNGVDSMFDAACKQLIGVVVPRLLGVLQSDGRSITPTLIHGDLWERNVGIDMETGGIVVFDPGCTYAHNEMEFGTVSDDMTCRDGFIEKC